MFLLFRTVSPQADPDDWIALSAEETKHVRARRLHEGADLWLGDGISRRWPGRLELRDTTPGFRWGGEPPATVVEPTLRLYTAVPEGKRWDWLVQKAVELGVTHLVPVSFERSERHGSGLARARRLILSAAQQSRRFFLPVLEELSAFDRLEPDRQCVALDVPGSAIPLQPEGKTWHALLVGPEGGFTKTERERLDRMGTPRRSVSRNVLRVETAALAGLAILAHAGLSVGASDEL